MWTRRRFLATGALLPWALHLPDAQATPSANTIPVGLEMYSVRDALGKDAVGTVRAIAAMGYQGLEFYAPYFAWTEAQAQDMRKLLDELKIRCFSTHNDSARQTRSGWLARGYGYPERSRGKTGTAWTKSRLPQSSTGIHPDRWSASDRNPGEKHQAVGDAAARCWHLHRSRR